MERTGSAPLLAGLMAAAGITHFVAPKAYEALIPSFLGPPRAWVYGSGALELACAAGLAVPRTRSRAGWATAALLVAVFPGNVTMAARAGARPGWFRAAAYARLPMQIPLVWWAVRAARSARLAADPRHTGTEPAARRPASRDRPRTGRRASRRPRAAGGA